jgi:quinol monooxygenase YgiN
MTLDRKEIVPMTVTLGIVALLEAQPGRGSDLAEFLKEARGLAVAEEGTVNWYAFKISDTSYGIFDTFATDDARTAHINGRIPAALAKVSSDLLASDPDIRPVEILAFK